MSHVWLICTDDINVIVDGYAHFGLLEEVCPLSSKTTEELFALWDEYVGTNLPGGYSGEDIHLELNLRGCGDYCAI
jgi:hypothetical protein